MTQVYLIGAGYTAFKRWPKRTHLDLAREALSLAFADAGLPEDVSFADDLDHRPESIWFGNCGLPFWGQPNLRGQVLLSTLIEEERLPFGCPTMNVESGCATGGLAAYSAFGEVMSGRADLSLALGVEKTFIDHNPAQILDLFLSGTDRLNPEAALAFYRHAAEELNLPFELSPKRIPLVDISALHARAHMDRYGVTRAQVAQVASKSHANGALNPKAQYQTEMSPQEILDDVLTLDPLTRSMCAPISDGAAALLVASEKGLARFDEVTRRRAIPLLSSALSGGGRASWDEEGPTSRAAQMAYRKANLSADDVDFAEVHDATAYSEILHLEALGFCEVGSGGRYSADGETSLEGARPINTSGGLISKGHPLAASGIAMIAEVMTQLRQEGGARQLNSSTAPQIGLVHNGGGLIGFQEALSSVTLLGAPRI